MERRRYNIMADTFLVTWYTRQIGRRGRGHLSFDALHLDRPLGQFARFTVVRLSARGSVTVHKTVPVHLITNDKEATHGHIARHQKTVPLYIGLATGFCGSFTSFSTFISDAFLAISNNLASSSSMSPNHELPLGKIPARNGGYSFLAVVGVLIVEPAVSISALKTGGHIALATESIMRGIPTKPLASGLIV